MEIYGEFCIRILEKAMRDVDPEFIYLSEPISDSEGPLISPAMFEEFMVPVYERITVTARDLGCENILLTILRDESLDVVRDRLEEIIPPLLQSGRYVPLAGGRVREEIPWAVYKSYREVLAGLLT